MTGNEEEKNKMPDVKPDVVADIVEDQIEKLLAACKGALDTSAMFRGMKEERAGLAALIAHENARLAAAKTERIRR